MRRLFLSTVQGGPRKETGRPNLKRAQFYLIGLQREEFNWAAKRGIEDPQL